MRLSIQLEPRTTLNLPIHYNGIVQGLIYNLLEPNLAKWLHSEAYRYAKRTYKMFTFSRLMGRFDLNPKTKRITFSGPVSFKLASHNTDILASLAEHLLKAQELHLGQNPVRVQGVEILKPPQLQNNDPIHVKTLSPITIYSTFDKLDGSKVTHYYNPQENAWNDMLLSNLARKAKALEWEDDPSTTLQDARITPLRINSRDRKIIKYKGFVIQAWTGLYEMNLPPAYAELAYDVGLGSKNSQGFGMVEVVNERKS